MEGVVATGTNPAIFKLLRRRRYGSHGVGTRSNGLSFEDAKDRLDGIPLAWQRRLSDLQAKFGLEALDGFDRSLVRRREIAERLIAGLDGVLPMQRALKDSDRVAGAHRTRQQPFCLPASVIGSRNRHPAYLDGCM